MTEKSALELAQEMRNLIDAHWDWLAPIIRYIPLEKRDDALLEYLFKTSGIHFAKHAVEDQEKKLC